MQISTKRINTSLVRNLLNSLKNTAEAIYINNSKLLTCYPNLKENIEMPHMYIKIFEKNLEKLKHHFVIY